MGSGSSRMGPAPSRRQRRRPTIERTITSLFICGASSSTSSISSSGEMEDYQAEFLVNSAEHGDQEKLKFTEKCSDLSLSSGSDVVGIKTENEFLSGRFLNANPDPEVHPYNGGPGDKGKCLSESKHCFPAGQSIARFRDNEIASTSYIDESSADSISDAANGVNSSMNGVSSQIIVALNNPYDLGESLASEISAENNVSEAIDFSSLENFPASTVSNSPTEFCLPRDDSLQDVMSSSLGISVSEMEQNREDRSLMPGDVMGISSSITFSNNTEISSHEARRNSRRLYWDAFSRRSFRRETDLRIFGFSSDNSHHLRSRDRWPINFGDDFFNNELQGDVRSRGSRIQGNNEQQRNSRSEIWETLNNLESVDLQSAICPSGIHADGSCSCQSGLLAEESAGNAGISRVVLLAEALFEVLDQLYRQPMLFSLSMVSLPAPESVVNSFLVKIHRKAEILERADGVSQCYICLDEYEEGDKIRVLPCHHEYHMSCIDKWLKEIHGVCPLCRGDVSEGFAETSV